MTVVAETTALKFRGDAKDLADMIGVAAAAAPARSTRPVLQNLLLRGHDGVLEVTASDLEVSICVRVERAEIGADGKLLVNAGRLLQILRELSGEVVEVEGDERAGCTITTGDSHFRVMGEDPEDFPELPGWPTEGGFRLGAEELNEMIRRTQFATHPEKTRYAMNGILLDLRERRVHLVATDGKRLALCKRELEFEVEKPVHVVVPTKGMALLQRVTSPGEEEVEIAVEKSYVHMRTVGATVSARLVEGHFPPYEEVLPRDHDKVLKVTREGFMSALRRAALLGTKDTQAVRFSFAREGLEMTARVPEVGESRVTFPLDYPFDPVETGFNPTYFTEVLKVLQSPEFRLELKDHQSAAVIREEEADGRLFVYLLMPLNLGA